MLTETLPQNPITRHNPSNNYICTPDALQHSSNVGKIIHFILAQSALFLLLQCFELIVSKTLMDAYIYCFCGSIIDRLSHDIYILATND